MATSVFFSVLSLAWNSPMMTIWGATGVPEDASYPRPMMVRGDDSWRSLNGKWQIDTTAASLEHPPFGTTLNSTILVPYPIESTLGGVHRMTDNGFAWYRLVLPNTAAFAPTSCGESVLLHFEASDYNTTVWLNGVHLGDHSGGYDPFYFDATSALAAVTGEVEIIVGICDTTADTQATGKQSAAAFDQPEGIFYTSTSGLWGTVWTECVPSAAHIADIVSYPDLVGGTIHLEIAVASSALAGKGAAAEARGGKGEPVMARDVAVEVERMGPPELRLEVNVTSSIDDTTTIAHASVPVGARWATLTVTVPPPLRPWTPTSPYLYGLVVRLVPVRDEAFVEAAPADDVDTVRSYFGLRSLTLGQSADGRAVPLFNGMPLFMMGTLDQGFWPESLHTAPTDEALRSDVLAHKALGFNMVRKHIKMEPRRWYWHCDTLGLLVWQDVPSKHDPAGLGTPAYDAWLDEMLRDVQARRSHPSIVLWVTYNEGWGQTPVNGTAADGTVEHTIASLRALDSTRLINDASGGRGVSFWVGGLHANLTDVHHYSRPEFVDDASRNISGADPRRALVLGEYGGIALTPSGHEWAVGKCHGYTTATDRQQLGAMYADYNLGLQRMVGDWSTYPALSAAVYTEIADVETECNGLLTYDRLLKVDPELIARSNQALIANATATLATHMKGR